MEASTSQELKDVATAIARLRVAFKDATTGADAPTLADVDKFAKEQGTKEMISSPTSQWFKLGTPDEGGLNPAELEKLKAEIAKAFPSIPLKQG